MIRPIAIVGAGLAGLSCALHLHRRGLPVRVFEASNGVGGRVRTDAVDGFLLDRGFQVLQTSYPEAQRMLDFDALELEAFDPGALVPINGQLLPMADPLRQPAKLIATLRHPAGELKDKLRVAKLRFLLGRGKARHLLLKEETKTSQRLEDLGFSADFIRRFFQPFFAGVFLEPNLETSSRWFELLFRLFTEGDATLPTGGMQQIPEQLAAQLPEGTVHLRSPIKEISARSITLDSGDTVLCSASVVATNEPAAAKLLGIPFPEERTHRSVHCLYFSAPKAPYRDRLLMLGNPNGLINNLCVPSIINRSYAPPDRDLISVTVLPHRAEATVDLEVAVRTELDSWFGAQVAQWQLLDHQLIDDALPPQRPGQFLEGASPIHAPGIFRCGDYLETSSIHGAMVSGRKTAEQVRRYLKD